MTSNDQTSAQAPAELDILVFNISDVHCGIDSEFVGRMLMFEEARDQQVNIRWFHQAFSFGDREVVYRNPRVVTLRGSGAERGLVIDQPRDIVRVAVGVICPLPFLFEMTKGLQAFWGSVVLDEKIVLLIDPNQL